MGKHSFPNPLPHSPGKRGGCAVILVAGFALAAGIIAPIRANAAVVYTHTVTITGYHPPADCSDNAGELPCLTLGGVLTLTSNQVAKGKTDYVTYFMADGYAKKADLGGVVLRQEDIENNCASMQNAHAVNPVGGTGINCHPVLHPSDPGAYPLTGDLTGRYCRYGPGDPCPELGTVPEMATGSGGFLTVGAKDHGAMTRIDYQMTNGVMVRLLFPAAFRVEVTRVVIVPAGSGPFSAVLAVTP